MRIDRYLPVCDVNLECETMVACIVRSALPRIKLEAERQAVAA